MPPPAKKIKRDSTENRINATGLPPLTSKEVKIHQIPQLMPNRMPKLEGTPKTIPTPVPIGNGAFTMAGLKPGEFLVPAGPAKPGQKQQFLVVKRLPGAESGSTNNTDAKTTPTSRSGTPLQQIRLGSPSISPSVSPFLVTSTTPPPSSPSPAPSSQINVTQKTIQIPMPTLRGAEMPTNLETSEYPYPPVIFLYI